MKGFYFFSCIIAVSSVPFIDKADDDWQAYKRQYNKSYSAHEEEIMRRKIFLDNRNEVKEHNLAFERGFRTFKMGINRFSDMGSKERTKVRPYHTTRHPTAKPSIAKVKFGTPGFVDVILPQHARELEALHGLYAMDSKASAFSTAATYSFIVAENSEIPDSVDWRLKGAVSPVKDQGECGSCWAFSTTGSVEGQLFLRTGKLVSVSEQNLIDCLEFGCKPGKVPSALDYIHNNGIDTEASYPYEAKQRSCRYNRNNIATKVEKYYQFDKGNEQKLKAAVASAGPVSVCFYASPSFHRYKAGVFYDETCNQLITNHCVLIVGYGTERGQDYWLVKNSWNAHWGDEGYIKMARNKGNHCGIASFPIIPVV